MTGESAWFALQAALALGERLGLDSAAIQDFLRRETGFPDGAHASRPSRVTSG